MATEQALECISLVAAADLSAKQFYAVKVDSAGKAALAGAGEFCIGVLQNKPTAGQTATIAFKGITKVIAAGSITAGAVVASDANAKATTASKAVTDTQAGSATDALIGSNVLGIALADASASDLFPVLLTLSGAVPTTAA